MIKLKMIWAKVEYDLIFEDFFKPTELLRQLGPEGREILVDVLSVSYRKELIEYLNEDNAPIEEPYITKRDLMEFENRLISRLQLPAQGKCEVILSE